jgi:hypothetical protein
MYMTPSGLFGRCEEKTGIEPFGRLVEQVMTTEPYTSAQRVFWIVDNGSSHAGKTSVGATPAATSTISSTASTNVITYQPPIDRTYLRERPLVSGFWLLFSVALPMPRRYVGRVLVPVPDTGIAVEVVRRVARIDRVADPAQRL